MMKSTLATMLSVKTGTCVKVTCKCTRFARSLVCTLAAVSRFLAALTAGGFVLSIVAAKNNKAFSQQEPDAQPDINGPNGNSKPNWVADFIAEPRKTAYRSLLWFFGVAKVAKPESEIASTSPKRVAHTASAQSFARAMQYFSSVVWFHEPRALAARS